MKKNLYLFLIFLFPFTLTAFSQSHTVDSTLKVSKRLQDSVWVDSVFASLSLDQKIAQLFLLRTYSNKTADYYRNMDELIGKYKPGGLCFFQGGPKTQQKLTKHYQSISQTPLLIAMDAEWGPGMRLDSSYSFPYQMTLGSIDNDSLIYQMGTQVAEMLMQLGVHINFAPVADINNNPNNPVINSRSFGEDKMQVAKFAIAYMNGLQDHGIIATAKHFPGHGDTDSDSHLTLPFIPYDSTRIDSLELYPFKKMIEAGLKGVMVAHLFIPALDSTPNLPTTLSPKVVNYLLRNKLNFQGLIITDALDMKGVTSHFAAGDIEVMALLAGNDILLLPQDIKLAIDGIKKAIAENVVPLNLVEEKCRKILHYKYLAGLDQKMNSGFSEQKREEQNIKAELLERKLYKNAVTLVNNKDSLLPLLQLDSLKLASLSLGSDEITSFQKMLSNYAPVDHFNRLKSISPNDEALILKSLLPYNLVIIGIHNTNIYPGKNFGISADEIKLIDKISKQNKVILTLFSGPYSINLFPFADSLEAFILAHQDNKISNEIAAQMIMGAMGIKGHLPVGLNQYPLHWGIYSQSIGRLQYTIPEETGINRKDLKDIDSLVLFNIKEKAFPGCQVLIAKNGKIIYQKSFGYHTYVKGEFVKNTDLYDLASITKVAATTISIMRLYDEKKIDIDQRLARYLPYLTGSNKDEIIIRDLMTHQARLKPWIPFYLNTMNNKVLDKNLYSQKLDENHTLKVASNLYINKDYSFTLYDSIAQSGLLKNQKYKYSDLGFYLLKQAVENLTNKPLDRYVSETFYKPLGMQYAVFNPLNTFSPDEIVPTENDTYFRHQLIHGYVHDPGAAMLGGVSGHAGLFANANDMAILMQMLLQKGYYGGIQYLEPATVTQFTKQQFPLNDNRRGIGFDKPEPEDREEGPTCKDATLASFGHSGFTGTYMWVDPEYQLIYIFLSNRINPTANNTKLIKMNTRTKIQQIIYNSLPRIEAGHFESSEIKVANSKLLHN